MLIPLWDLSYTYTYERKSLLSFESREERKDSCSLGEVHFIVVSQMVSTLHHFIVRSLCQGKSIFLRRTVDDNEGEVSHNKKYF